MITWNYRVFQEEEGDYVTREVIYAEDGAIMSCTTQAVEPFGQTLAELAQCLEEMQMALKMPILKLRDIPQTSQRSV